MVQKVQECMFLETSQCFCLTSPEVGCWHAETLEGHPYNKGYLKVSASSQKSWDTKCKKVHDPWGKYLVKEETAKKIKAYHRQLTYVVQQKCVLLLALVREMVVPTSNAGRGGSN